MIMAGSGDTILAALPKSIGFERHPLLSISCHFIHLAKIQGMKSISKPLLLVEIYASQEIMSTENLRKNSLCRLIRGQPITHFHKAPFKNHDPISTPNPKKEKGLLLTPVITGRR
jgi:hypothetical protein